MVELSGPWLLLIVLLPAGVALSPRLPRALVLATTWIELLLASALAVRFQAGGGMETLVDPWDPGPSLFGTRILEIDELSSLLLPFAALLFAFVLLSIPRTERRGSSRRLLAAETVVMGFFATVVPLVLAVLWAMSALNVFLELRSSPESRSASRGVGIYMSASVASFFAGVLVDAPAVRLLLIPAVLIRKGIIPFHSWVLPVFEHMPLSAAALFASPQLAAYAAVRLVVPLAGSGVVTLIGIASLATALYGAGLSLVQKDVRRALGAFFMSQSALVMAGLDSRNAIGLAGGLALWISAGIALAGFTMTIAALEARRGRLFLDRFAGGYERKPLLAMSFLVLGLASVGFPGTLGFAGEEALVHGAFIETPLRGALVLLVSALNGITVLRCYFALFCGAPSSSPIPLHIRPRERVSFFAIVLVLLLGGLFPRSFLASRQRAAQAILQAHPR